MNRDIERRTIAAQLADRIEREIRSGTWKNELPGKRTLAGRFNVNVKTSAAAIDLLEQRALVGPANVGKGRLILPLRKTSETRAKKSDHRLLVIHQLGGISNTEDFHLLQRMGDAWARIHGGVAWAGVDFPRCKSPGPQLDALIKRHTPSALLLHMPGEGWGRQAAERLPYYQVGGPYEADIPISLGACSLSLEVRRAVKYFRELGHRRILLPVEGMGQKMWESVVDGLREHGGAKPDIGNWEDYCPRFPENVPEAWDGYWQKAFTRLQPTAVLVFEDTHLLSFYGYCLTHGLKIPNDVSVISQNYEKVFEWLRPRPMMMRYPAKPALSHFQQWIGGGLKAIGKKYFPLDFVEGGSVARPAS